MEHPYHIVDVFTMKRFGGNQLAVFPEGDRLTAGQMQQIANEMNFSETAFVLQPENPAADFRLRIFTPKLELPMAGHPSVGTAFVLKHIGRIAEEIVTFEEQVGFISMTFSNHVDEPMLIWMQQPLPSFGSTFDNHAILANLLSLDASLISQTLSTQVVSTGVPFLYVPVTSMTALEKAKLRTDVWEQYIADWETPHIFAFTMETLDPAATVHSRMFAPAMGISEDPATGAASGPLGAYLWRSGLVTADQAAHMLSEQGYEMGRPSQVHIRLKFQDKAIEGVYVGGSCVYIGHGIILT